MLPIILDPARLSVLLIGDGDATERRAEILQDAGVRFHHEKDFRAGLLEGVDVLFAADVSMMDAKHIYETAKPFGILINIEDIKEFCDFHMPAIVRRGDLLLTVSTKGASPRVARRLRMMLENIFPEGWAQWLKVIEAKRNQWKAEGADIPTLAANTDALLDEQGWLKADCACMKKSSQTAHSGL